MIRRGMFEFDHEDADAVAAHIMENAISPDVWFVEFEDKHCFIRAHAQDEIEYILKVWASITYDTKVENITLKSFRKASPEEIESIQHLSKGYGVIE